jgi:hypothetical protein
MGPIDYSLNIANPLQSVLQGFQFGRQMRQDQEAQQAAKEEAADMAGLMQPGTTFADYRRVAAKHPKRTKELLDQFSTMDKIAKESIFSAGADAFGMLNPNTGSGVDAEAAVNKLEDYAKGFENSGDKQSAAQFRSAAEYIKMRPDAGRAVIGTILTAIDPTRAKSIIDMAGGETTQLQKTYDWLKALKGETYADRYLAVETEKFVPVPDKGVYRGSDVARSVWDVAEDQAPAPSELPPSAKDVPPPRLGPNGLPTSLTPDQYRVTAEALGKAKTDKWIKDNNIKIVAPPRTATINGKTFYQIDGAWFDNPEGR